ncbi:MAG: HypC/HybG/HupF family hydrogenase formation chaperone [Calditrichia bacterium]
MCLAVPGKIVEIIEQDELIRIAKVDFGGVLKDINLAYVPEAQVGQYVNVHVGFAISVIDEEEAREIFTILQEMGDIDKQQEFPQ